LRSGRPNRRDLLIPLASHVRARSFGRPDLGALAALLTCAKLGVSFREYLGHRLRVPGAYAPYLPDLVRLRSAPA
jgi:hypothetical protein